MIIKFIDGPFDDHRENVPDTDGWEGVTRMAFAMKEKDAKGNDMLKTLATYQFKELKRNPAGKTTSITFQHAFKLELPPGQDCRKIIIKTDQVIKL